MDKIKIALQLYTVREECENDFIGTLEKVADLGYEGVELAGVHGLSAEQLKEELDRLNLKVVGSHIGLDQLEKDLDKIIDYNKTIDNSIIVCPYAKWESKEGLDELACKLNAISDKLNSAGLQLLYHNHSHEFEKIDDSYGLDLLYNLTKKSNMLMELDTHWVRRADKDVIDYMNQNKDILKLVHIKDMKEIHGEKTFAAIGEGIMDIPAIIDKAVELGCSWVIVENDQPEPNGIENVTVSINNLKKMFD
ncbi:sugar phosphate isomerase/epimerase family protein [Vallitalea guaymasensis]|uniref:sugar phosphate isomerase/epimerase family protein n=1 Tax=Vallitalea guaymasensis TaxID=1185412 RepID=UPI000DE507D2|nr:sugar phosphate isomerase/epimerase [Vallitalea guaymasensis]